MNDTLLYLTIAAIIIICLAIVLTPIVRYYFKIEEVSDEEYLQRIDYENEWRRQTAIELSVNLCYWLDLDPQETKLNTKITVDGNNIYTLYWRELTFNFLVRWANRRIKVSISYDNPQRHKWLMEKEFRFRDHQLPTTKIGEFILKARNRYEQVEELEQEDYIELLNDTLAHAAAAEEAKKEISEDTTRTAICENLINLVQLTYDKKLARNRQFAITVTHLVDIVFSNKELRESFINYVKAEAEQEG